MTEPSFTIRPIDLLDPAQHEAGTTWMDVHAAVQREVFGDRGSAWTLAEIQQFHRSGDRRRIDVAAWRGERLVGALEVMLPVHDNLRQAMHLALCAPRGAGPGHRVGSARRGRAHRRW